MPSPTWTIPRRNTAGATRASFPQERLFLLDRLMPGLPAYNVPRLIRVGCTLDDELLRRAFEMIVERHEILRTTLTLRDGLPVQEVAGHRPFELTVADLRGAAAADQEAQRLLAEIAGRAFDIGRDVLLRAALVHVRDGEDLLLTVLHHAGSDHASTPILLAELDAIYSALSEGCAPELPELAVQYADFARWQREQLDGAAEAELVAYWREKLAGAPERLELPADRVRPSVQSYRGALAQLRVGAAKAAPLRDLAAGESVSLFMVLLAAFKTLLHRYTGAQDIVLGTPVSGRHYEEIAPLLGYFSNTLVLRDDLSGDPTFRELLARVKVTVLEAQIHQELPFERLVELINPERAQSHSPLFQVLFAFDVAPAQPPMLAGHEVERLSAPGWEWSRFDLSLALRDEGDGSLCGELEYATDLFDAETIDRLIGHLSTLLDAIARDPTQRLSELPMLTEPERRQFAAWNSTSREYDRRCLQELFAERAARTPHAVAVVDRDRRLTYAELDRASNRLAHALQARGVIPGALVGVCLERSVDLVAALLATLKAGAAYLPIEPTYPPQRQELMLADAGAQTLITDERFLGVVDPRGGQTICLERDDDMVAACSDEPPRASADPEQLAYVIYTSGSTGRPKGVRIRHRSVANLLAHMRSEPGLGEGDVVANLTTPAFDLSVPDWFLPLTTGARLVIVPREATLDGVELADWLARSGATFVQATPTTWQLLVDAGWTGNPALKIVCGGAALPRALADQLLDRGASLWHMYGPTETTVWSSIRRLAPGEGPKLGGPIANTSFHVLDSCGRPVPVGVPGELQIGGEGVCAGYHERPELNAQKFASGRYRTGDLVRWRADGTLEFLGRVDQQVKLRGFRIELGEIEAALDAHPDVRASVASVREDVPGDQRLVAYVVPAAPGRVEIESLRRLVKAQLPPFMVPSAFVALDALPVNVNGKLDRAALPAPDGSRPSTGRSYTPPQTPLQETLASVWREVLGVERVGIDDDFFELGGHSLLAVKMLARVHETLGLDFYLGRVFEHPTIRVLAQAVGEEMVGAAEEGELAALLAEMESHGLG